MSRPSLETLFKNNKREIAHKWSHYFGVYERYLDRFRGKPVTMLEVGVNYGGSLRIWDEYFEGQATLIGCDINPDSANVAGGNIQIEIGDQGSPEFWAAFRSKYPAPDIIIDDGSHMPHHQILTLQELWPFLKDGGVYICEDTHSNYLSHFGVGVRHEDSFLEYAKGLVDEVHAWWSDDKELLYPTKLTHECEGIFFHDSIVVMEKKRREMPFDVVTGTGAEITNTLYPSRDGWQSIYRPSVKEQDMPPFHDLPEIGATLDAIIAATRRSSGSGAASGGDGGDIAQLRKDLKELRSRLVNVERLVLG